MKLRMIAAAVLFMIASAAISTNANAAPWRGGWRAGIYIPAPVVRVCPPAPVYEPPVYAPPVIEPPVAVGGYYGGYGYARPRYHEYYGHEYYGHRGEYRGGYGRGCRR